MAIKFGNSEPTKFYVGANEVDRIYVGASVVYDSDAASYIAAVETADGQALEDDVKTAIYDFVVGCKTDGIWDAIKASCILAGARTLNGALVPLKGDAPTNFNFVSGDYNRKTGLIGDGSTKYLDSNRNNNADPQNSHHLATCVTQYSSSGALIGAGLVDTGTSSIFNQPVSSTVLFRSRAGASDTANVIGDSGLIASSRSSASDFDYVAFDANGNVTKQSQTPYNGNIYIFARNSAAFNWTDARLSFYSIGEALDLAALDTRVSNLMTAIGAAIP